VKTVLRVCLSKEPALQLTHTRQPFAICAERVRGTTHVAPPPVTGPARYAAAVGSARASSAAAAASGKLPSVPSIMSRVRQSLASDRAVGASDGTAQIAAERRAQGVDDGAAKARGAAEYNARSAAAHAAAGARAPARRITATIKARSALPAELRDLRTTPVEVPVYLPRRAPAQYGGDGAGAEDRIAFAAADTSVEYTRPRSAPLHELSGARVNAVGGHPSQGGGLPIHLTVNLPKEAFQGQTSRAEAGAGTDSGRGHTRRHGGGHAGGANEPVGRELTIPISLLRARETRRPHLLEARPRRAEVTVPIMLTSRAAPPAAAPAAPQSET
jgi:hypothetical protein